MSRKSAGMFCFCIFIFNFKMLWIFKFSCFFTKTTRWIIGQRRTWVRWDRCWPEQEKMNLVSTGSNNLRIFTMNVTIWVSWEGIKCARLSALLINRGVITEQKRGEAFFLYEVAGNSYTSVPPPGNNSLCLQSTSSNRGCVKEQFLLTRACFMLSFVPSPFFFPISPTCFPPPSTHSTNTR